MKKWDVKQFVAVALLSALAFMLMFIKFPVPPFPSFLTVDFSDIPVLVAALLYANGFCCSGTGQKYPELFIARQ